MSAVEEQRKSDYLESVNGVLKSLKHDPLLQTFSKLFYERVPTQELLLVPAEISAQVAAQFYEFVANKTSLQPKLRVFNPTLEVHGWESDRTIIEIANTDGPFLVDSVVLALNSLGISAQLIIHPVMFVSRDEQGAVVDIRREAVEGYLAESLMHVEVDFQRHTSQLDRIEKTIRESLEQLQFAVSDWKAMVQKTREIASELSDSHQHMSKEQVQELSDFLNWMADDHFTFLGYREYVVEDQGSDRVLQIGRAHV